MEAVVESKSDVWRQRIEAQRASGQSVRAWCQASGMREQSFYWWRRRLSPPLARTESAGTSFARVMLDRSSDEPPVARVAEPMRLRWRGERELILPASMPLAHVAELLTELEKRA